VPIQDKDDLPDIESPYPRFLAQISNALAMSLCHFGIVAHCGSAMLKGLRHSGASIMPEHRGRKHHQDRVAETLRLEIGAMIEGELVDPRINFCYVTEVALNPGGKSARVYIAVDNAVKDIVRAETETIAGLEAAKGYIRFEIKERMGVRHVPELTFLADRSGRFQARIVELMDRSRKRQKYAKTEKVEARPAAPEAPVG
jgi:ribosome-binding factor A